MTSSDNLPVLAGQQIEDYYVEHGGTATDLARRFDVPVADVVRFYDENDWKKKRELAVTQRYESSLASYKDFVSANRVPMLESHLKSCQKLQSQIDAVLMAIDTDARGADVKVERMTRALKSLIDSTGRILAITETGVPGGGGHSGPGVLILHGPAAYPRDVTAEVVDLTADSPRQTPPESSGAALE
jgi:hypothetical protein